MGPSRRRIFRQVDVRSHHVSGAVDEISVKGGAMVFVLLNNAIMPWGRIVPGAPAGNVSLTDEPFPLVEISALLGNRDHDERRTGHPLAGPDPFRLRLRCCPRRNGSARVV